MRILLLPLILLFALFANSAANAAPPSLDEVKSEGAQNSSYLTPTPKPQAVEAPQANLVEFKQQIEPLLREACFSCHGPDVQEREFRIDTLDPDLIHGDDVAWWIEVFDSLSKGEMPPADADELPADGRARVVEWLSHELQAASQVARNERGHSSFRRMTRYEFNYALQDLLGLPHNFAEDLPPETVSEDGFLNSSEMLQMSVSQFETYRSIARQALLEATVRGKQPKPVYYAIKMGFDTDAARKELKADLEKLRTRFADNPDKLESELEKRKQEFPRVAYYTNRETGLSTAAKWSYGGAKYAHAPVSAIPETPSDLPNVAVIPVNQKLIIDLGDHLPDFGTLRMKIRAAAVPDQADWVPTLRVYFGHQASNDSRVEEPVGEIVINSAKSPSFHEFEFPLSEVMRNVYRGSQKLGDLPNPAEFVKLQNASGEPIDIQIDYIEITAPYYSEWPPQSHRQVFHHDDERENLKRFMTHAWRRPPTDVELAQRLKLHERLLPQCEDSQDATIEVMSSVLTSPKFLYVIPSDDDSEFALATRLAMFLWSSIPDQRLVDLAATGKLSEPDVLVRETERMLNDPRADRFPKHFVRQWLGMQLLDHIKVDDELRAALHEEPIAFFAEVLRENASVMDFLHADYTIVNSRLAKHYGIAGVYGNEFRRVALSPQLNRGGLLQQAGLLAMNSDGKDSHPLKRGIWLLESILNDPPPPPPPAVPAIDLSDPDILKLTLKERMEDHRNDPACMSCHQRIDPWGIAFENYDALGRWRTSIAGKPVDANSVLFNNQDLNGIDGLKRYLLANRQDQFARSMTHKLMTYALGRPLSFADRAEVDRITAELRQRGDGLRTLIQLIVTSDLFQE